MSTDLLVDLGVIAGMVLIVALVGAHFQRQKPEERTEEEAVPVEQAAPELPPLVPLKTAAEVAEVEDKTLWLAEVSATAHVHEDEQRQAEPLLCDEPGRPPHSSEAWLTIRLAELRHRPVQLRWERLTAAIGSDWAALVAEEEELTRAADMAVWEHLTETALTDTQEITEEMRAAVFGGVR